MINFWVSVLALSILLYVLLDGFDLGIGILYGFAREDRTRRAMMSAIAPVWDGNETWLVVSGVVLWGAFPIVYATLFSAFYLPLLFMLAGLILRGVTFEFRDKARHLSWVWDAAFAGGSLVATFMQGTMVGALERKPPGLGPMARASVLVRISAGRRRRGHCTGIERSPATRARALLPGCRDVRGGVRHVRRIVLALHDSVFNHDRRSCGAAQHARVHVLGRRSLRLAAHAGLHGHQLPRVPWQGQLERGRVLAQTRSGRVKQPWTAFRAR
jgi:hypothetical protein